MLEALEALTIPTVMYVNTVIIHLICTARWSKELLWHCLALSLPTIYISAALANDMLVGLNVIQGHVQSQFAVATIAISMGIIFTSRISLEARKLKVDNSKMRGRMNEAFLKLDHERTQNVALNISTANTIEEERKSIAQELHDGLSSTIIGSKMAIDHVANSLKSTSSEDNSELAEILSKAGGQLDISYQEMREFTHRLRPETLKLGGLTGAIRELAATFHTLDVLFDVSIDNKLPEDVDITIYRIVQECLTNTAKHSDAESVEIRIEEITGHYWFTYRDNGSKQSDSADYSTHGMGLTSITNRITSLDSLPLFEDPMGRTGFFLKFSFEPNPA
jgi:signal transduction histidine kinase